MYKPKDNFYIRKRMMILLKYESSETIIPIGILVVTLLVILLPHVGYAAELSAFLVSERDRSEVLSYKGIRTITLQYPAGSSLAQEFDGKNERIQFTLNGTSNQ